MSDEAAFLAILDAHLEAEVGPETAAKVRALSEANRAVLDWYGREFRAHVQQRAAELAAGIEAVMWAAMEAEWA